MRESFRLIQVIGLLHRRLSPNCRSNNDQCVLPPRRYFQAATDARIENNLVPSIPLALESSLGMLVMRGYGKQAVSKQLNQNQRPVAWVAIAMTFKAITWAPGDARKPSYLLSCIQRWLMPMVNACSGNWVEMSENAQIEG